MGAGWQSIEEPGEDRVVLRGRPVEGPACFERYYARAGRPSEAERKAEFLYRASSFAFSGILHLLAMILIVEFVYLSAPILEETILTASLHRSGPKAAVAKTETPPQKDPSSQKEQKAAEAPLAAETPRLEASTPAPVIGAGALQGEARVAPVGVLEAVEAIPESDLAQFSGPGTFEHRSGSSRSDAVGRYGGNLASEAAVDLGLKWLSTHQSPDGRWSAAEYSRRCPGGERCGDVSGPPEFDHGITGLALLAFLGAGHTHLQGGHKESVALGLQWLLERQDASGFFFDPADPRNSKGGMYGHGIAMFALGEAASMTRDEKLLGALQAAVAGVEAAQQFNGGWYYTPDPEQRRSEFTLGVWQLMGLRAAEKAGVKVPERVWNRAKKLLLEQQTAGGGFRYSPGSDPTIGATGAGVFARCMLGLGGGNGIERGLAYLETEKKSDPDPARGESWQYLYAWYYRTLSTFQVQGRVWRDWNRKIRPYLVSRQNTRGHAAGSWNIIDYQQATTVYGTALCILMLETYYRYLPMASDRGAVLDAVSSTSPADAPSREEERRIDEVQPPSAQDKAERRKRDILEARAKLGGEKPEDRYIAARKLSELGDRESARGMIEAARLETGRLRAAHLLFLGRLKSPEALPFLMGQLDDLDPDVRSAAVSALTSITGVYIVEASRWRDWWRDEQKKRAGK